jgi:hypothetical protein
MNVWRLAVAFLAVGLSGKACTNPRTQIRIPVPIRACVVKGGPWTTSGSAFGASGFVSETMDQVNAIWNAAGIAFLALPDPRVIDDPQPPGMALDVPPFVAKGMPGDIRVDDMRGFGSDEAQAVVEECDEAWNPGVARDAQPGFTVVFVRELIWTDGGPTPQGGYSADLSSVYRNRPQDLCHEPYNIVRADVAGRWSIIETFDRNFGGRPPNFDAIAAHELGHDLLLRHGDGVDNDQNGVWDEFCDPDEMDGGSSLMDVFPGNSTTVGLSQRRLARAAALVVPTANP